MRGARLVFLCLVFQAAATTAQDNSAADEEAILLDPISVTEPVPALDAELWRLQLLLETTTPCLGCDARSVATPENRIAGLLRFMFVPAEPQPTDEARRVLSTVRCKSAGPGSEFRCP